MKASAAMEYVLFLFTPALLCHPINKSKMGPELKKDEKHFPNGTVIGKFSYTDNEGNPILVRYFADDASYGIELKSVKTLNKTFDNPLMQTFQETAEAGKLVLDTEESTGTQSTYDANSHSNTKSKGSKDKTNRTEYKSSSDYEVYFQNELKTPQKCGKDKIRVYLDEEKRKIREASLTYMEAAKYCEQI